MIFKIMNNYNKSKQNIDISSSKSDDKYDNSESELDEPTSHNIEEKTDTVS